MIRLMIADDHTLFREGVKALLSTTPDLQVVGEAGDGAAALAQALALQPDIVLMDIHMPEVNGLQATRAVLECCPQTGVVMLTMLEDDASLFAAMRAGARGYVLNGANHEEMLQVIRAVAEGQALFGPKIAARIMNFFNQPAGLDTAASGSPASEPAQEADFADLSEREREVLVLIADGYNNQEIAQKLVISPKTVRNHITSIFSKLQVADRAQAIRRARSAGFAA